MSMEEIIMNKRQAKKKRTYLEDREYMEFMCGGRIDNYTQLRKITRFVKGEVSYGKNRRV